MELTFLGTGTSQGVPVIACECEICTSKNRLFHRLRASLFISRGNTNILVDIGPDFRAQMLENDINDVDFVLLTHEHNDHIAGIDDIRSINFRWRKDIPFLASKRVCDDLRYRYDYIFKQNPYPGSPKIDLIEIDNEELVFNDIPITPIEVFHGKLPVFGFRIDNIAYITDAKTISTVEKDKIRDLDILIINALRKEEHYAHFNLNEAVALIEELKPKKAYLTHLSHIMGNPIKIEEDLPQNIYIAYDGLKIKT